MMIEIINNSILVKLVNEALCCISMILDFFKDFGTSENAKGIFIGGNCQAELR